MEKLNSGRERTGSRIVMSAALMLAFAILLCFSVLVMKPVKAQASSLLSGKINVSELVKMNRYSCYLGGNLTVVLDQDVSVEQFSFYCNKYTLTITGSGSVRADSFYISRGNVILKNGKLHCGDYFSVNGDLRVNGGSIDITSSRKFGYLLSADNITMTGGKITIKDKYKNYAIYTQKFKMSGGTVAITGYEGTTALLSVKSFTISNGTVKVTGGTKKSIASTGISTGNMTVKGGTVNVSTKWDGVSCATYKQTGGKVTATATAAKYSVGIEAEIFKITGGSLTASGKGQALNGGKFTIKNVKLRNGLKIDKKKYEIVNKSGNPAKKAVIK